MSAALASRIRKVEAKHATNASRVLVEVERENRRVSRLWGKVEDAFQFIEERADGGPPAFSPISEGLSLLLRGSLPSELSIIVGDPAFADRLRRCGQRALCLIAEKGWHDVLAHSETLREEARALGLDVPEPTR